MRKQFMWITLAACLLMTSACKEKADKNENTPKTDNAENVTGLFDADAAKAASQDREKALEMPVMTKDLPELLLKREGYYVSYNKNRCVPNWVAWRLTAEHTNGRHLRSGMTFMEDDQVPRPRATDNDYYGSRYDRGHICPSGDNKWSWKAQQQSFLFSNVCPQNHDLNKGDWNDLEIQCRYWAKKMGDLYIVAGPVFYNGVKNTIGKNKVAVPDAFFKVVLAPRNRARAIGFIYPNRGGHKDMNEYLVSVDEVERITGIDFFPLLDDRTEENVESAGYRRMMDEWQVEKAVSYYNKRSK